MMYRGFKIERVRKPRTGTGLLTRRRVEYFVSESIVGYHWQEIGSANTRKQAKEMVNRVADVREALSNLVGTDLNHQPTSHY